jgi:hypothetical protein
LNISSHSSTEGNSQGFALHFFWGWLAHGLGHGCYDGGCDGMAVGTVYFRVPSKLKFNLVEAG